MTTAAYALSPEEVARFHEDGFLAGPYQLCTPEEMATIRERIDREVFGTEPPFAGALPEEDVRLGLNQTAPPPMGRRPLAGSGTPRLRPPTAP
ncbi:MAG TPA: hypothetical protein VFE42_06795 [Chloroflexota bacterium]|nr:hypothetical protein [Chloroflexota bacterium]